ncbi:hypothetical protein MJO28_007379 [Puccinia striiformis f. sp. tritici]|uniref:Uncharacterized protein n=1 Tax=Puccinia striiformis f. sp. tritici TaxID=168172 RepID=A0ACC0EF14_9BASI|nr:hypothetical protein MJO28_007379 [Puccinia striiformis f. sp. tritici]KAI7955917.1 hypothetical protein MJO29_007316 [Puccinia striiformis f. sp. tritici]
MPQISSGSHGFVPALYLEPSHKKKCSSSTDPTSHRELNPSYQEITAGRLEDRRALKTWCPNH